MSQSPWGTDPIGRPVRIVSIAFRSTALEKVAELVDSEGARGADIIALPETFLGQDDRTMEPRNGRTVQILGRLAKKHKTYIVCGIDRYEAGRRFNSAVVLDRSGEIICIYDKIYPFYAEYEKTPAVQPGQLPKVFKTDFGRVGLAICFDVNWPNLWKELSDQGAELVICPSAYSAGRALQAHAINFHYYIVSSSWIPDCRVFDIDGDQISHGVETGGHGAHVTRISLDLDRCIFHWDRNIPGRLEKLLKECGADVECERMLPSEAWFVLRAKRPGVSARELASKYGFEELSAYIRRSESDIARVRTAAGMLATTAP